MDDETVGGKQKYTHSWHLTNNYGDIYEWARNSELYLYLPFSFSLPLCLYFLSNKCYPNACDVGLTLHVRWANISAPGFY